MVVVVENIKTPGFSSRPGVNFSLLPKKRVDLLDFLRCCLLGSPIIALLFGNLIKIKLKLFIRISDLLYCLPEILIRTLGNNTGISRQTTVNRGQDIVYHILLLHSFISFNVKMTSIFVWSFLPIGLIVGTSALSEDLQTAARTPPVFG
jgi:hypothetical protein